jgi:hypothetical protein
MSRPSKSVSPQLLPSGIVVTVISNVQPPLC